MKKAVAVVTIVAFVSFAAGGGYWYGKSTSPAGGGAGAPGAGGVAGGSDGAGRQAKGGAGGPGAGAPMVAVEVAPVVAAAMPQIITAVGSLRSDESVTLRPETAGRISAITFKEGQRVTKGTPLVKLDAAIPQAEYQQARANLTLARSKFDRAVDLANRNYISGQAKDEAENNFKVAQAAVALAEAKLAKTDIRAPFSGIIGLRSVSIGDYVKEGADLVNLEAIDPLKVDFRIPETFLRMVQAGQSLEVSLDALPGKTFDGRVIAINPLIDAAGRSVVIRAQVRNQDTTLRPGMFARVRLITREQSDALVVPEQALVPLGTEQFVFRVVDGKVARIKVQTGQRRDGKVEIVAGLAAGDIIVTAGQLKIRDGVAVRVAGDADTSPPAKAQAAPMSGSAGPIAPAVAAPVKADGAAAHPPKS
ncbi:MAG: efflux RND transporter periplasmic adaptor subunit [Burkholderiales bacterium]|nr:efflux RND transporter periplasmic adaptor subunit [Burkholderiales bacterium]